MNKEYDMKRTAKAEWHDGLKDGHGTLSTESGALDQLKYSFNTRFESGNGTNPEELIAAAHAGCFSMAFSGVLGKNGYTPDTIHTTAKVSLESVSGGFSIPHIELDMKAKIKDINESEFLKLANDAKDNCPVSKLMNASISLSATLE